MATFSAVASTFLASSGAITIGSSTAFSIVTRMKASAQNRGTIFGRGNAASPDIFFSTGETLTDRMQLFVATDAAITGETAVDNTWRTIIAEFETDGNIRIYNNSDTVSGSSASGPTTISTSTIVALGCINSDVAPVLRYTGDMEYVSIYNKVLSGAEKTLLLAYGV